MNSLVVRWMSKAVSAGMAVATLGVPVAEAEEGKACGLLTASEIQSVIGTSVTLRSTPALPGGKGELCIGNWSDGTLMLRLATGLEPGRDRSGSIEKAGLEMMKNMGAQVDVKTFGPIVCSTLVPPSGKEQIGYNTTCTVSKDTAVAGIEVTAKNKTGMVPIDRLHQLAEKMTGRF